MDFLIVADFAAVDEQTRRRRGEPHEPFEGHHFKRLGVAACVVDMNGYFANQAVSVTGFAVHMPRREALVTVDVLEKF
jgi:hypothetical protein